MEKRGGGERGRNSEGGGGAGEWGALDWGALGDLWLKWGGDLWCSDVRHHLHPGSPQHFGDHVSSLRFPMGLRGAGKMMCGVTVVGAGKRVA